MRPAAFAIAVFVVTLVCDAATFRLRFDPDVRAEPASGRLVVYLIRDGASVRSVSPADGPFWYDPQPLYGINVINLKPGETIEVGDAATAFGPPPSELPPGRYRAQAVLDMHHRDSAWRREPGNLYSEVITFEITPDRQVAVEIPLTRTVTERRPPPERRGQVFEVRSKLLSDFRGEDVVMRAGVVFPSGYDAARAYPVIYEVPGFGDDHYSAFRGGSRRREGAVAELARNAFFITLDPESPNGHTLFADSAVNGPCGEALVRELIPALEAKFNLIREPSARLLRGHSSGGWSVLWLATQYPDVFGACWSSSPDPVDFRRFERINIYDDENAYFDTDGNEIPAVRDGVEVTLTVRGENEQEEVLGEDNSSAQQWDSWQAVFGTRAPSGRPTALFDARTGRIDRAEAEHYKRYAISLLLRESPDRYGPIYLQRVRLVCGDADDFYLNEAVALLRTEVEKLRMDELPEGTHGYVKLLDGYDHSDIFGSEEMRAFPQEMLDHLRRAGHIAPAAPR